MSSTIVQNRHTFRFRWRKMLKEWISWQRHFAAAGIKVVATNKPTGICQPCKDIKQLSVLRSLLGRPRGSPPVVTSPPTHTLCKHHVLSLSSRDWGNFIQRQLACDSTRHRMIISTFTCLVCFSVFVFFCCLLSFCCILLFCSCHVSLDERTGYGVNLFMEGGRDFRPGRVDEDPC